MGLVTRRGKRKRKWDRKETLKLNGHTLLDTWATSFSTLPPSGKVQFSFKIYLCLNKIYGLVPILLLQKIGVKKIKCTRAWRKPVSISDELGVSNGRGNVWSSSDGLQCRVKEHVIDPTSPKYSWVQISGSTGHRPTYLTQNHFFVHFFLRIWCCPIEFITKELLCKKVILPCGKNRFSALFFSSFYVQKISYRLIWVKFASNVMQVDPIFWMSWLELYGGTLLPFYESKLTLPMMSEVWDTDVAYKSWNRNFIINCQEGGRIENLISNSGEFHCLYISGLSISSNTFFPMIQCRNV